MSGSKRYDGKVRNHLEVAKVPSADCVAVVQSRRTNEQVREGNHFPASSCMGIHSCGDLRHLSTEALNRNRGENLVEIVPSLLCLVRSLRPMKAVFQLDYGNRRKHNLVLAVLLLKFRQQAADRLPLLVRRRSERWNPGLIPFGRV
jgi:hypothetical protein